LGLPKGFPVIANFVVGEALERSDDPLLLFLILFGKYGFDDSGYRFDTLVPPRFRIDIQRDAAGAAYSGEVGRRFR